MGASTRTATLATAFLLAATPALGGEAVRVEIDQYRFQPPVVRIKPGAAVEWLNGEKRTSHSIWFEGEEEGDRLFPGESFRKTFDKPGRYPYRCGPHPEMVGVVEVVP